MLTFCQICFLFLSVSEYLYFKNTFTEPFELIIEVMRDPLPQLLPHVISQAQEYSPT